MFLFRFITITLSVLILANTAHATKKIPQKVSLSGVEKRTTMTQVPELWINFEKANYLHSTLKAQPQKVYVIYNAFSKDYQQADVLIGYDIRDLKRYKHSRKIDIDQFTQVLESGHYTTKQLSDGWQKFDYRKQVKAVLEIHTLASLGRKEQVELLVQYQ